MKDTTERKTFFPSKSEGERAVEGIEEISGREQVNYLQRYVSTMIRT